MGLRVIEVKVIIIIIVVFGLFLNRTVSIRLRHCKELQSIDAALALFAAACYYALDAQ